jgi:hypothetical protein
VRHAVLVDQVGDAPRDLRAERAEPEQRVGEAPQAAAVSPSNPRLTTKMTSPRLAPGSATSSPSSTTSASTLGASTSARGTGIWVSAKRVQTHSPSNSSSRYLGETASRLTSCSTGVWFSTAL